MSDKKIRFGWSAGYGRDLVHRTADKPGSVEAYAAALKSIERVGVEFVVLTEEVIPTLNAAMLAGRFSAETASIGLIPTLRINDYPPYKLARLITSLEYVTLGRIGWNADIRMTPVGMRAHDLADAPGAELEREIADEFLDVCHKLWTSWAPGALVEDLQLGIFADPEKVNPINHVGAHFKVKGPLNLVTPARLPMLVQTVTTVDDARYAGSVADVVVVTVTSVDALTPFKAAIAAGVADAGRPEDAVKLYFTVSMRVGETAGALEAWDDSHESGISLEGDPYALADAIEVIFDRSGYDGVVISGGWDPYQVNRICTRVLAVLTARNRLATSPYEPELGLRHRILTEI